MDYSVLIDFLYLTQTITSLEKDFLDTYNELQKNPFDMDSANWQILSNTISYPEIAGKVNPILAAIANPRSQVTAADRQYILQCHLAFLVAKEGKEQGYGN